MYACIYVIVRQVIRNHSHGGMTAYAGDRHDEVPGLMGIKWEE